jgi:hypothetical protein
VPDPFALPTLPTFGSSPLQPMKPEEEDSLLSQVTQKALGGLHYVGGVLDKTFGGRALRGVLGGKPEELLSLLPGSDTLGVTNETNRVSGEDLLKQWGMLEGDGEKGTFELRDLAGPLTEIALDPSTYLTLGTSHALTSAGQAAEKAGTLAPTMAGRIKAGQAGLAGVGLPFAQKTPVLTGKLGEWGAQKLGALGDRALYSAPGRVASRLFDPNVMGMESEAAQRAARGMQPVLRGLESEAKGRFLDAGKALEPSNVFLDPTGKSVEHAGRELRAVLEETASAIPGTPLFDTAQAVRGYLDTMKAEGQRLGRPINDLDDVVGYAPRQRTLLAKDTRGYTSRGPQQFPTGTAHQLGREDLLTDFLHGTQGVNNAVRDRRVHELMAQQNKLGAADHIRQTYLSDGQGGLWTPATDQERWGLHQVGAALTNQQRARMQYLDAVYKQAEGLADWIPTLDPQYAEKGLDFFGNNALTDFGTYALKHARAQAGALTVHDMLASAAKVSSPAPDLVPLADALRSAGLDFNMLHQQPGQLPTGAMAEQFRRLQANGVLGPSATTADLLNVRVPKALAEDAARTTQAFRLPEALDPIVKVWDTITNLTKAGQTSLWPAFHARNAMTGLWQNFVIGAKDPRFAGPQAYLQPFLDANTLRTGGTVPGAAQVFPHLPGLTDQQATKMLAEEMFQHNARVGLAASQTGEALGLGTHEIPGTLQLPGRVGEKGVLQSMDPRAAIPGSLAEANPLNLRGVGGANETTFAPARWGQELGASVDDVNRASAYLALRRQGYESAAAALKSKAAHYDYTRLTGFEREVMRRAMPFYNWTRQNLPFQLEQLISKPGGATANAIKVGDNLRSQAGFVPDYIEQGLALPIGKEDDGRQRFLSHLGLPFEDVTGMIGSGEHPVLRSGEKMLGQLNPLIKAPLEAMTGRQFFAGRDLENLYGPTGDTAVDQLIMNSPLSRAYTSARTLMDERKGAGAKALNLLAPAKVTDVDMDLQRQIAARQLVEEALAGNKNVGHFEELYVKPENLPNLSPQELQLLRLYKTIEAEQAKAAKAKKAAGQNFRMGG